MLIKATKFSVTGYNKLPNLDAATTTLTSNKQAFDAFVRDATTALATAELANGQLAALLLHRHWKIGRGRMMVERPRVLQSGKIALITSAEDALSACRSGAMPSRWAAPSEKQPIVPLEFSVDPFVHEIYQVLCANRALLKKLATLLRKYNLHKTIGYMIVPRKSLSTQVYADFVETNADGLSIVTGEYLSRSQKRSSIQTGWPLSRSRRSSVFACCYCSHGPTPSCRHPLPDPPVCQPHGCV